MNTKTFQIPVGYSIVEKTEIENIDTAANILSSLKRRQYTRAKRNLIAGTAELVKHVGICPNCGEEVPAYSSSSDVFEPGLLSGWSKRQSSLFDENEAVIEINKVSKNEKLNCPKCGCVTPPDNRVRKVWFCSNNGVISVRCEILDFSEVIRLSWLPKTALSFPLFEEISFNLRRGHTFLSLYTGSEKKKIAVRDITSCPENMSHGAVYKIIMANREVIECIAAAYQDISGEKWPFSFEEISPEKYVAATRFIGYEHEFYDAVPYETENWEIDKSFKSVAEKLHNKNGALKLFEGSLIPKMKSVRRTFFENKGLLFYLSECEMLWEVIGDPNLFCTLLTAPTIYTLLSYIHERSGLETAIRDLGAIIDKRDFVAVMAYDHCEFLRSASQYVSMNEVRKKRERERWKRGIFYLPTGMDDIGFSCPVMSEKDEFSDCMINGYSFFKLRTRADFTKAGRALLNCLSENRRMFHNVFCVRRLSDGKYVAAIEVTDGKIIQAYAKENTPIELDKELEGAYNAWRLKNRLTDVVEQNVF